MGFIEETGAAQYYRDARILPIYEGTTAIQANDFVGRKVLRDGGAVVKVLVQEMRATVEQLEKAAAASKSDAEGLALIARRLAAGIQAYEKASGFVLRSEEHTSETQSIMSISYADFCMIKKKYKNNT